MPERDVLAHRIVGTLSWVVAIRHDSLFAFRLHAHYVTEARLTLRGWNEILLIRASSSPGEFGPGGIALESWADSSLGN